MKNYKKRVDDLFRNAPNNKRTGDLKEELMANLIDGYFPIYSILAAPII